MTKRNTHSDFVVYFSFAEGRPAFPWKMVFTSERGGRPSQNTYVASFDGEKYTNASLTGCADGQVLVEFKRHNLGAGSLRYEFRRVVPNDLFIDGSQVLCDPVCVDIQLWEGVNDDSEIPEQQVDLIRAALRGYSAYEVACRNGFEGTEEEWLASLQGGGGGGGDPEYVLRQIRAHNESPDAHSRLFATKVDKIDGKGLSTEDFTTLLRQKLEGLKNYDDTTISVAVEAVQRQLDTLLNGNVSSAIDTFREIEAFLAGITDAQTLTGLMTDLRAEILAKIPNVPAWALASSKPKYTALEVGAATLADIDTKIKAAITDAINASY